MPIPATKSQADIIQNFQLNSGPLFNARNPIHLAPFSIFPTIENVILNFRRTSSRVCRWQTQTDQAARWLATGLTEAERGFRKVSHSQDLSRLAEALESGSYYAALKEYHADLPEAFRAAATASLRDAPSASHQQPLTTTNT